MPTENYKCHNGTGAAEKTVLLLFEFPVCFLRDGNRRKIYLHYCNTRTLPAKRTWTDFTRLSCYRDEKSLRTDQPIIVMVSREIGDVQKKKKIDLFPYVSSSNIIYYIFLHN